MSKTDANETTDMMNQSITCITMSKTDATKFMPWQYPWGRRTHHARSNLPAGGISSD